MTVRKALVLIGGVRKELPTGDTLEGSSSVRYEPVVSLYTDWAGFSGANGETLLAEPQVVMTSSDVVVSVA